MDRNEHRVAVNLLQIIHRSRKGPHSRYSQKTTSIFCNITTMPSLISPYVLGAVAVALLVFRLILTAVKSPVRSIPGPWYSKFTQAVLKYHTIRG